MNILEKVNVINEINKQFEVVRGALFLSSCSLFQLSVVVVVVRLGHCISLLKVK